MGGLVNREEAAQVGFLLQHVSDVQHLSRGQWVTIGSSALGAAITAGLLVAPLDWHLVIAAAVGALLTNILHAVQQAPRDRMVQAQTEEVQADAKKAPARASGGGDI